MLFGQIIKIISGLFFVRVSGDGIVQCHPRGIFKYDKKKVNPLVGDFVYVEKTEQGKGIITKIEPRETELIRPRIANINQAVIVSSFRLPSFKPLTVDRFLAYGESQNLDLIICITKQDLIDNIDEISSVKNIYEKIGYPVIVTSILTKRGLNDLKHYLVNKTSVFAGESGVGKSSLLQQILPNQNLRVGEVSQRLGRGKHTTRVVELLPLTCGGQVADTPGFSKLSLEKMTPNNLGDCFPEIKSHAAFCYYRNCLHVNEPRCNVAMAAGLGEIHCTRYQSYLTFLQELKNERRNEF